MASGLEQTRRNSAILGCLTLSSIFASFSTFLQFAGPSGRQQQPDRMAWMAIWTVDRIGPRIGSDRIGIFAFSAEELFWEKLFLNMTQVARNKKSEFLKLESNLRLVQTRLDYSNRFDSDFFFRAALLIPANFLIVSSERYLQLSPPSSIRAMSCDQASFWNCNRMKLCNRKFPSAILLKIILRDDV